MFGETTISYVKVEIIQLKQPFKWLALGFQICIIYIYISLDKSSFLAILGGFPYQLLKPQLWLIRKWY